MQFEGDDTGTKLTFTEQAAYLDGQDVPEERERGTGLLLDGLARHLTGES